MVPRNGESMVKTTWIGDVRQGQHDGQSVELKGWVKRARGNNNIWFVVLRDSTGTLQCVGKRDVLGDEAFDVLRSMIIETSAVLTGDVRVDERADGGHELSITGVELVGAVNSERPFPITEADMLVEDEDGELTYGGTEHTLNHRHLYLRTTRATTMLKLRSSAFGAIHSYFRGHDFLEYQAPNFVAGAVEGGSTLFEVPYFGKQAYLTQSWQLYAEAAMPALERLYTIAPSFRAEKSRTRRHLTEFWHAEMEMAWATNNDIMAHGEGVVRHIARTLLDEREEELTYLERT